MFVIAFPTEPASSFQEESDQQSDPNSQQAGGQQGEGETLQVQMDSAESAQSEKG